MKSYTDLEQSKKLAEILPLESADMCYPLPCEDGDKPLLEQGGFGSTPCWSLAALLDVLPDEVGDNHYLTLDKEGKEYCCSYEDCNGNSFRHCFSDNPIDACVVMIEKLNELKML
jgi:hypothetical protein